MDSGDTAHLSLMKRPDLGVTFTKLHCWTLTHYSKCVFMDADTLVRREKHHITVEKASKSTPKTCYRRIEFICLHDFGLRLETQHLRVVTLPSPQVLSNIDELFEREELSAAPDPGWPDCFNSGVFVFRPSNETHEKLLAFCSENGSFDGERHLFPPFLSVFRCLSRSHLKRCHLENLEI